jgi:hypothetical protein
LVDNCGDGATVFTTDNVLEVTTVVLVVAELVVTVANAGLSLLASIYVWPSREAKSLTGDKDSTTTLSLVSYVGGRVKGFEVVVVTGVLDLLAYI